MDKGLKVQSAIIPEQKMRKRCKCAYHHIDNLWSM